MSFFFWKKIKIEPDQSLTLRPPFKSRGLLQKGEQRLLGGGWSVLCYPAVFAVCETYTFFFLLPCHFLGKGELLITHWIVPNFEDTESWKLRFAHGLYVGQSWVRTQFCSHWTWGAGCIIAREYDGAVVGKVLERTSRGTSEHLQGQREIWVY